MVTGSLSRSGDDQWRRLVLQTLSGVRFGELGRIR